MRPWSETPLPKAIQSGEKICILIISVSKRFEIKKKKQLDHQQVGKPRWLMPTTLVVRELKPDNRGILQYFQSKYTWLPRELYDNTWGTTDYARLLGIFVADRCLVQPSFYNGTCSAPQWCDPPRTTFLDICQVGAFRISSKLKVVSYTATSTSSNTVAF